MLKKIKKARDLVFTTSKRRARRKAISSADYDRQMELRSPKDSASTRNMESGAKRISSPRDTDDGGVASTEGSKMTEVFDYSTMKGDYKSPLDPNRLRVKPWQNAKHGRYKDIFNLAAVNR